MAREKEYHKGCSYCDRKVLAYARYDARHIFLCYCCADCWPTVQKKYRSEVLTDPDYDLMGEQLDED